MGSEKIAAFGESWSAMALEASRWQQRFAEAFSSATVNPAALVVPALWRTARQGQGAAASILSRGLEPLHKRALANVKRLAGPASS